MEIREVIHIGKNKLKDVSDSPTLDVEWILLHVLKKDDASWLVTHQNTQLQESQLNLYLELIQARATGKPLAYILGHWSFYGRDFLVNKHVLVPRPDTENLIDAAKSIIKKMRSKLNRPLKIADVGTGSGCIAVTLLLETADIDTIYATDISPEALAVAQINADKYMVRDKIEFMNGDMLEPLKDKAIDLIVSNPPYVPSAELLQKESKDTIALKFEPQIALDGGKEGTIYMSKIKNSGIPAIVEGLGGDIYRYNF